MIIKNVWGWSGLELNDIVEILSVAFTTFKGFEWNVLTLVLLLDEYHIDNVWGLWISRCSCL